jgi:acyl-CoA thioester hydrolase
MGVDFSLNLKLRIDWSELDLFGHVNNVTFLKYAQAARVNYWEHIGLCQHFLACKEGPMLASVTCHFRKPLHYPGEVIILTRVKEMGNTSFSMQHRICDSNGVVAAEVDDVIVMFDFNKNKKMRFPDFFRTRVEALETSEK